MEERERLQEAQKDDAWDAFMGPFFWWQNIEIVSAILPLRKAGGASKPEGLVAAYGPRATIEDGDGYKKGIVPRDIRGEEPGSGLAMEATREAIRYWEENWEPADPEGPKVELSTEVREDLKALKRQRARSLYLTPLLQAGVALGDRHTDDKRVRDHIAPTRWAHHFISKLAKTTYNVQSTDGSNDEVPLKIPKNVRFLGHLESRPEEADSELTKTPVFYARTNRAAKEKNPHLAFLTRSQDSPGKQLESDVREATDATIRAYIAFRGQGAPRPPYPNAREVLVTAIKEKDKSTRANPWKPKNVISWEADEQGRSLSPADIRYEFCCPEGERTLRERHRIAHPGDTEDGSRFCHLDFIPWDEEVWTDIVPSHEQVKFLNFEERCYKAWFRTAHDDLDLSGDAPERATHRSHSPSSRTQDEASHEEGTAGFSTKPYRILPLIFHSTNSSLEFLEATVIWENKAMIEGQDTERMLEKFAPKLVATIAKNRATTPLDDTNAVDAKRLDWENLPERLGSYLWEEYGLYDGNHGWALPIDSIDEAPKTGEEWLKKLAGGHEDWIDHWRGDPDDEGGIQLVPVPRGRLSFLKPAESALDARFVAPKKPPFYHDVYENSTGHIPITPTETTHDHLMIQGIPSRFEAWRVRISWHRTPVDDSLWDDDSPGEDLVGLEDAHEDHGYDFSQKAEESDQHPTPSSVIAREGS